MSKLDECQPKGHAQMLCFALSILDQRTGFLMFLMAEYVVQEAVTVTAVIRLLFLLKNRGIRGKRLHTD